FVNGCTRLNWVLNTPARAAGLRLKPATRMTSNTLWTFFVANQGNSSGNRRRPQSESAYAAASRQRKPPQVARRHPPEIYRRRRVAAIAIVVFLLVLVVYGAGACGPGANRSLQGDQLGPDPEESAEQHLTRAAESVEDARRETYALVTFDPAVDAQTAAQAVDAAERVNAVIAQD